MLMVNSNKLQRLTLIILFVLFGGNVEADTQPVRDPTRGELLYSTYCVDCHKEQLHWRDKKLVKDWISLRLEVRRWQKITRLGWNDEDIAAVAQYLNDRYYHYPVP